MNMEEIKKLSAGDREKKLKEIHIDLMKLNGQVQTGTAPKSPGQIKELKRTVARIKTLQNQEKKVDN